MLTYIVQFKNYSHEEKKDIYHILSSYSSFSTLSALRYFRVIFTNLYSCCLQQNYSLAELDEKISALKQALLRKSREAESLATHHLP